VGVYCLDDFHSQQFSSVPLSFNLSVRESHEACQTTANYIVSQLSIYAINFPGDLDNSNVKYRAVIWAISEALLFLSVAVNYLPPRWYSRVFKFSVGVIMLDFFLCVIWLPIGVSKTYGFRSVKDVFTMTCTLPLL
jgi:translation initiation factor 5B